MWTSKQGKTLGQTDTNASMEVPEFLVALLVVITLPEETPNKQWILKVSFIPVTSNDEETIFL